MHVLPELLARPCTNNQTSHEHQTHSKHLDTRSHHLFSSNCIQVDNVEYARKGSKTDPDLPDSDKLNNDYKNGTLLRHEVLGQKFTIYSLNASFVKKAGWSEAVY